jgi:hypothetical protein
MIKRGFLLNVGFDDVGMDDSCSDLIIFKVLFICFGNFVSYILILIASLI